MSATGSVRYQSHTAAAQAAILSGASKGMDEAAQELLSQSQALVPVDSGDLRDSGQVTVQASETLIQVAVSYDTDYAVAEHENMTFNHPGGGQAKFLEQPLYGAAQQLAQIVAEAIHSEIGG